MKSTERQMEASKYLSGWKEIAKYMGKGIRTVQRYERELGFPIRRPAGKSRSAVLATREEVDAWVAASPIRGEFLLSRTRTDSGRALESLEKRVEQMMALRTQMRGLRSQTLALRMELRVAIQGLKESMAGFRREMYQGWALTRDDGWWAQESNSGKRETRH